MAKKENLKIKYLISDIDGTLLKPFLKIFPSFSYKTLKEIENFCNYERKLILASGRDLYSTQKIAEQIERKINKKSIPYLICLNGALIFDNYAKRVIFSREFDTNSCWNVVNFFRKRRICFFLLTKDKRVIYKRGILSSVVYFLFFRKYSPVFFDYTVSLDNVQKISVLSFYPTNKKIRQDIIDNFGTNFYCSSLGFFYLELIDKSINKFYAWQKIAKKLNVKSHEWCAIGNEENDILLLENSAFGVFMDLKKAKHLGIDSVKFSFVTSNKRGQGVAKSIREMRAQQYY